MMLVKASSTARVTERRSGGEKPKTSVRFSSAPRTTQSNFGSLCNSSFSKNPSFDAGLTPFVSCRPIRRKPRPTRGSSKDKENNSKVRKKKWASGLARRRGMSGGAEAETTRRRKGAARDAKLSGNDRLPFYARTAFESELRDKGSGA